MAIIYPSLYASDLLHLGDTLKRFEPTCEGYHLDLMDGHFVPNISCGVDIVHAIARATKRSLHIHLMVEDPIQTIDLMHGLKNSDMVIFHIESKSDAKKTIDFIYKKNIQVGLAVRPKTPLNKLYPFLGMVNQVLLMSVEPGFSGQPFLESATDRLKELVTYRKEKNLHFAIAMDGGINKSNIENLVAGGLDCCIIGSAIFTQPDPLAAFHELNRMIGN